MRVRTLLVLVLAALACYWLLPALGSPTLSVSSARGVQPSSSSSSLRGRPSLSASFINTVLTAYHSPAAGQGQALYTEGLKSGIDPAYALAFFLHESAFGTRGVARFTHSLGNIICTPGFPSCYGRYRAYPTWDAGFADWYSLISGPLYLGRGLTTLEQIIPIYAPPSDNNDVSAYISSVRAAVSTWRAGSVEVH